jgi:hypothetical protein
MTVRMRTLKELRGEKPAPVSLHLPKIPHKITLNGT